MSNLTTNFDSWLTDKGAAALVLREHLIPVEGADGVFFPPTFAASEDKTFKGGYNIDTIPDERGGKKVCLIDSVGSQANRIEPLFMTGDYATLVPQIVVKAGSRRVNLLEAGHRAGDAIVRCAGGLGEELQKAFKAVQNGDAEPLAKIAPTSLVFGVWDSRGTQAKVPRLISSTIRAWDVHELTRSAQYVPAIDYVEDGLLEEPADLKDAEGRIKGKHPFAQRGFVHVPATGTHGGIMANGGIRRDAVLHLAALRLLSNKNNEEKTKNLCRYILGLALTAFTSPPSRYMRQGCNLVLDPEKPSKIQEVHADGKRDDVNIKHDDALKFAKDAANAFGVGENRTVEFSVDSATKDLASAGDTGRRAGRKRGTT